MRLAFFTPYLIKNPPKKITGPIAGLMILLISLFAGIAAYGQCPGPVSTPSGCPTNVDISLVYPTVSGSCANPSDGGCATWTFSNLPYSGDPSCPVTICFIASQGCGVANGNLCLYGSDGMGGCVYIATVGDRTEYCVEVASTTYQVTVCRPGSGPVSLNSISITPCCTPTVSCNTLANVDIEGCADDIPTAFTNPDDVFTYEACGATVTMSHNDVGDTGFCTDGDGVDFTRTYTLFFDGVPQTPTCSQTIKVSDTTDPEFANCPASPIDLGCNPTTLPTAAMAIAAAGAATDNCGGTPTVIPTEDNVVSNGCNRSQNFVLTATDACGNPGNCTVTYTWQVVTAPVFANCTTGSTDLGCNPQTLPSCDNTITASNECGPVTVNCNEGTIQENGCNRSQTFTYTATACGLTSTCTRTFTWQVDLTPPQIVDISNYTLPGCNAAWPTSLTTTWSDNCSAGGSLTATLGQVQTNGCTQSRVYTFTVVDGCGNPDTETTTVSRTYDVTKPEIVDIPDYTLPTCNASWPTLTTTWTDNCSGSGTVTATAGTVQNAGCSQWRIYTFTKTDGCGNTDTETTKVTRIYDVTVPIFTSIPQNVTVQCNNIPTVGTPVAFDNCGTPTIMYNGETRTNGSCPDAYTLTRRWTAMDGCGNTRTATQRITVIDTTKPTFTFVPANTTVECSGCCGPSIPVGTPTATDNCDASVTIAYLGEVCIYFECPANRQLRRTWRATDNCGNSTTAVQTIDIRDTQPPTFTYVPPAVTIECSDLLPHTQGTPTATDGCDANVQITFNGQTSAAGSCPQEYVVTRQWTAVDDCGNATTATQTITVQDSQAPVFNNAPANITVMCGMVPPVPVVTATDNCDNNAQVSYLGEDNNGPNCPYTITRSWAAEDDCGNETLHVQVITVSAQGITDPNPEERASNDKSNNLSAFLNPNPAVDEVWISFDTEKEGEATLRLFDIGGRLVHQQMFAAAAGPNRYLIDLSGIVKGGMYTVQLIVADQRTVERLIVFRN